MNIYNKTIKILLLLLVLAQLQEAIDKSKAKTTLQHVNCTMRETEIETIFTAKTRLEQNTVIKRVLICNEITRYWAVYTVQ